MERTYQITPEMVGQNWQSVLKRAAVVAVVGVVYWIVVTQLFHPRTSGSIVGTVIACVICVLLTRPLSRVRLRVTDVTIENLDGPVIRKDEITRVNEYIGGDVPGIEIISKTKVWWWTRRDYRIVIPAALPEYAEIARTIREWTNPSDWHIVNQ